MFNRISAFSRHAMKSPSYTPLHLVDIFHYGDVAILQLIVGDIKGKNKFTFPDRFCPLAVFFLSLALFLAVVLCSRRLCV